MPTPLDHAHTAWVAFVFSSFLSAVFALLSPLHLRWNAWPRKSVHNGVHRRFLNEQETKRGYGKAETHEAAKPLVAFQISTKLTEVTVGTLAAEACA